MLKEKRNKNSKHSFKYSRFICTFNKKYLFETMLQLFVQITFHSHARVFCLYAFLTYQFYLLHYFSRCVNIIKRYNIQHIHFIDNV